MTPDIRRLTEEEKPLAEALYRNTFKIDTEGSQSWLKRMDLENSRAIVDDSRVLSMLVIIPYKVWMGGKLMKMGGISGVATWADQQGKGYAGMLVKSAIADMRTRGESLSILYPFSFQFYGRFGYALANHYTAYSGMPRDFAMPPADERVEISAADLSRDMPAIKECYNRIAPRWNTMMARHEERWERWQEYWAADKRQVYLARSAGQNDIVGYFGVMDNALPDGGFESTVTELMFESDNYFPALTRFIHRLPANVKKVKLIGATKPGLWDMFHEPSVATSLHACFQARVVDVEKACSERGYAADAHAEVRFTLTDEIAPWNAGTWLLNVKDGQGKFEKCETSANSALTLTIQDFSAIFTGYKRATEMAETYPEHDSELRALDHIFHDRDTRLLDFF